MTDNNDDIQNALEKVGKEGMATWTETNKREFVKTFDDRVAASRYVLQKTASLALDAAVSKKYVGEKQSRKLHGEYAGDKYKYHQTLVGSDFGYNAQTIGGRPLSELDAVAHDRSKEILSQLPPLQKAVQIISADLAKKITQRDTIIDKGKELTEKLVDLSQPIAMSEVDQKMSIGAFRTMVKDIEKKRTKLITEINELTEDGLELNKEINKALYAGLPGLSDAVVAAITSMMERAKALSQMGRRVGEQVMFGNSEAALELLRHFEQDEVKLSDDVKLELGQAMEKLKLAVGNKKKKQLKK